MSLNTKSKHRFQEKIMGLIVRENLRVEVTNMQFKFKLLSIF